MSGFSSNQFLPSENEPDQEENSQISQILNNQRFHRSAKAFLHPIDESEDFYDPFSELSLFLSRNIKKSIQENGSIKKWSGKIQAELLSKILPEFKQKFPKYQLGASALKKVWEKVSYYYEKLLSQKEAIKEDGKLNINYMIRENLKQSSTSQAPLNLPPYHFAHQLAIRLSECIATIDGIRPEVDHLTKKIWAAQKHILKDLSPMNAKSPYEEYDKTDKVIVKTLLEITSQDNYLSEEELSSKIIKAFETYEGIKPLIKNNQLTSTLSILLAQKIYATSAIYCEFSLSEKKALENFMHCQIDFSAKNNTLSLDTHRIELVQRILALYPIAQELPRDISDEELRSAIHYIYCLMAPKAYDTIPTIAPSLFVFINAEMHIINESKSFSSLEEIEPLIIKSYYEAIQLPFLNARQMEQFELLIWKIIDDKENLTWDLSHENYELLNKEIANVIIDNPTQSFKSIINTCLQYFKKIQQLPFESNWEEIKKKIEIWTTQNEMICRYIHFDPKTPFLKLVLDYWKNANKEHNFLDTVYEEALKRYPLLISCKPQLKVRLSILYKYCWYNLLSDPSDSSFDSFIKWHKMQIQMNQKNLTPEQITDFLEKISMSLIPLIPFDKEAI